MSLTNLARQRKIIIHGSSVNHQKWYVSGECLKPDLVSDVNCKFSSGGKLVGEKQYENQVRKDNNKKH